MTALSLSPALRPDPRRQSPAFPTLCLILPFSLAMGPSVLAGTDNLYLSYTSGQNRSSDIYNPLTGAATLRLDSGNVTEMAAFTGSASLTKLGAGTINLTGGSSYTGVTNVAEGTLAISGSGSLYSGGTSAGTITISANAALSLDRSDTFGTVSSTSPTAIVINGGGVLTSNGLFFNTLNNLTLNGGQLVAGYGPSSSKPAFFLKGTVTAGGSSASTITGIVGPSPSLAAIQLGNNTDGGATTFAVGESSLTAPDLTIAAILADGRNAADTAFVTSGLSKTGAGTLALTRDNTYTGLTTVSTGTLQLGDGGSSGSVAGDISLATGTILAFKRSDDLTLTGNLTGNGALRTLSSGTLILDRGTHTLAGFVVDSGATIILDTPSAGPSIASAGSAVLESSLTLADSGAVGGSGLRGTDGGASNQPGTQGGNGTGGAFELSGGTLNTPLLTMGGTGGTGGNSRSYTGSYSKGGNGGAGGSATFELSGGALNAATVLLGGNGGAGGNSGTANYQSPGGNGGGGGSATFNLSGGTLNTTSLTLGGGTGSAGSAGGSAGGTGGTGGSAALYLSGSGSLSFPSDGSLTIRSGGTLHLGRDAAGNSSTTGTVNLPAAALLNGTLDFAQTGSLTVATAFTGTGALQQNGGGTTILTGASAPAGGITVSAGTLQIGDGGSTGALTGNITNNAALVFKRSNALTYSEIISGTGSLTQSGAGPTTLASGGNWTGATTVSAGTLQIGDGTHAPALGSSGVSTATGGTIAFAPGPGATLTYGGILSGAGALQKLGAGTLALSAANTWSGATTVSAGTLTLSGSSGSPSFAIAAGATLELNVPSYIDAASSGSKSVTYSGSGTLAKSGAGQILWSGGKGVFSLASGSLIDIRAGTFTAGSFGNEDWSQNLSNLNVAAGATFSGVESNVRVGSLTGGGTITSGYDPLKPVFTIGAGITDPAASATFSGTIANYGGYLATLVKTGSGTQILTGANTYTGGTTISGGTLQIGDGGDTGSLSGNTVNNAALVFKRSGSLTYSGAITGSGTLTQSGGGTTTLSGNNTYAGGTAVSAGTLMLDQKASLPATGTLTVSSGATAAFNLAGTSPFAFSDFSSRLSGSTGSTGFLSGSRLGLAVSSGLATFSDSLANPNAGANTLALLKSGPGDLILSAANTHTGGTTVSAGRLVPYTAASLGTGPVTVFTGAQLYVTNLNLTGTLHLNGDGGTGSSRDSSLRGALRLDGSVLSGSVILDSDSSIGVYSSSGSTISAVISGNAALSISKATTGSPGTLVLAGANTFTGGTTVAAGRLVNNGSLVSAVTVRSGATLGGSGRFDQADSEIGARVTLESGSHLAPGNSPGTLTFADGLTLNAGMMLDFDLGSPPGIPGSASDLLNVTGGTLTGPDGVGLLTLNLSDAGGLGAGDYTLIRYRASSGFEPADFSPGTVPPNFSYTLHQGVDGAFTTLQLSVSPVPEPSVTGLTLAASGLGLLARRRRRVLPVG